MSSRLGSFFNVFGSVEKQERAKVLLLTACFCLLIGGYTIVKELKDSIFTSIVGAGYIGKAKWISMFILIPSIFLYSKLVDILRKHQLLYFYSLLYGLIGMVFVYYLGHPSIGLINTYSGPDRAFGWVFYFFMEGYVPFVVSVFWAFANSITSPESAKSNYPVMIIGSKFGGVLSASFAWFLLSYRSNFFGFNLSDVAAHQVLLFYASFCLLLIPILIYALSDRVSDANLHGYEAAYQADKQEEKSESQSGLWGMVSGAVMLARYPYLMGIFGMIFFYEMINVILQIKRLEIFGSTSDCISDLSALLYEQILYAHLVGLVIALIGTRTLMQFFGERFCLILVPVLTGFSVIYLLICDSSQAALRSLVLLRAINYAFASPLRESLYIPTVKEIKFKSKSWIEAFGGKFSKMCGAFYKDLSKTFAESVGFVDSIFFGTVISVWILVAYLLGTKYEKAIKNNEVIGSK